jgi:hypothetical protein
LLLLLPIISFGQDDVPMFSPPPRGSLDWLRIRPNFYDTKLTAEQKALLAPLPEDQSANQVFLKQKNTGIFRLHPKGKYEISSRTVSVNEPLQTRLPILGGGAYYSFTEKTNKLGPWSDIYLENGRLYALVTGKTIGVPNKLDDLSPANDGYGLYAGRSRNAVGLLTELSDLPLASVTLTTPGVEFLNKLSPPQTYADLVELTEKISQGFTVGDFAYRSVIDVRLERTYVLRSILYKRNGVVVYPYEPYHRLQLKSLAYDGSDTLVAFRIIRRHTDGSVTILWKRLQAFRASKIKGNFQQYTFDAIKQLFNQQIVKGMKLTQIVAFLDANNIEHSDYVEASANKGKAPENQGFVSVTLPEIERKAFAVYDLTIYFFFNEKRELINWSGEKIRR